MPEVLLLLQLALALTPRLEDQHEILAVISDVRRRTLTTVVSMDEMIASLHADPRVIERAWSISRARLEVLTSKVRISDEDFSGVNRLTVTATSMSHLMSELVTNPDVAPPSTRWPMQLIVGAARLVHQMRGNAYADAPEDHKAKSREVAMFFVQLGLRLLVQHDEEYAVEGVGQIVSMAAALSLARRPSVGNELVHAHEVDFVGHQPDPTLLGTIEAVMAPIHALLEYRPRWPRFAAAYGTTLQRLLLTVLAETVADDMASTIRSSTHEAVRASWRLVAVDMGLDLPTDPMRCWRHDCPKSESARLSRCARCEQATCAAEPTWVGADHSQTVAATASSRPFHTNRTLSDVRWHWPTHRLLCAVLKANDKL